MANFVKAPCDEGVIRAAPDAAPCAPDIGRWVLVATILGSSMAFIDGSVVNVALPVLQGDDLQRAFEELRTAQDPFAVWFRQRAKDLLDGLDLAQISPESMSKLVFDGPSVDEDEAHLQDLEAMERLGMISP